MAKFGGFWSGRVWREIETFACAMAGVPPPQKRYGLMSDNRALYEDVEEIEDEVAADYPGRGGGGALPSDLPGAADGADDVPGDRAGAPGD